MIAFSVRVLSPLLLVVFAGLAAAQKPAPGGWTMLFNGTDLTGWRYGKAEVLHLQTETSDKCGCVQGGVLVLSDRSKEGKRAARSIWTVRDFGRDFVLKLEFKASQEAVGSVAVRGFSIPVGDFRRRNEHRQLTKFKTDDWNDLEVHVRLVGSANGKALTGQDKVEVNFNNGSPTVTLNGASIGSIPSTIRIWIAASASVNGQSFTGTEVGPKGLVGLSTASGKIEFRNIRFREL